jgi:hypothetical protein
MRKQTLQDLSKFAAGLVAGDIFWLVWVSQQGLLPIQTFGVTITPDIVLPAFLFDLALIIFLIHYGWHIGKIPLLRERAYMLTAGGIFGAIAAAHLLRLFSSATINISGVDIPLWLSWFGVAITTYLSYASFRFALREK